MAGNSRKFGTKWDYPTDRKFRRVTAIVAGNGIENGASYEVERAFKRGSEPYYKLVGIDEPKPSSDFVTTMSTHPPRDPLNKLAGYPDPVTEEKKVKAIAGSTGVKEDEEYEVTKERCHCGDHQYKLKGKRNWAPARNFIIPYLSESTRLTRKFALRFQELSESDDKFDVLAQEFHLHNFTVKRLAREAAALRKRYGDDRYLEHVAIRQVVKEVLLSEGILSEIYCAKHKHSLREREATDVEYRELADDIIDRLDDYLYDDPKLERIGKNIIIIPAAELDEKLSDVVFVFSPKKKDVSPSFGNFKPAPGVKAISMPILDTKTPSAEDIQNAIADNRESLGHELTHYIDFRRGVPIGSEKELQKKGIDAYVNTPEEYNAYYQEGMGRLMKVAKILQMRDLEDKQDILPLSFRAFLKSEKGQQIIGSFLPHLNPKYRKKFIKRLYDAYPKVIDTAYTDKEKAAIEQEKQFYCRSEV